VDLKGINTTGFDQEQEFKHHPSNTCGFISLIHEHEYIQQYVLFDGYKRDIET
jgi:hypothetical protein